MFVLDNARIVDAERGVFAGHVVVDGERIAEVGEGRYAGELEAVDLAGLLLMSGMVDIHIHGGWGHDFIREPKVGVEAVGERLAAEGTTSFFASLTVVSHRELLELLADFPDPYRTAGARFWGVHSEGPFLSPAYKALMDERYLRDFDAREFAEMVEAAHGALKMMTVAPERAGYLEVAREAERAGVVLMIGHSDARCREARFALEHGARGFTHLYNAMSQHTHRDPGIVTAALLGLGEYAELICDGFHIDPDVIRATYRARGSEGIILITDAMLGRGMPDGEYVFSNLRCRKRGNTVRVVETGRISGSAISQLDAIRNVRAFTGCGLPELARMASLNPARLLGIDGEVGSIAAGKLADMLVLDDGLDLKATYVGGRRVYDREGACA